MTESCGVFLGLQGEDGGQLMVVVVCILLGLVSLLAIVGLLGEFSQTVLTVTRSSLSIHISRQLVLHKVPNNDAIKTETM